MLKKCKNQRKTVSILHFPNGCSDLAPLLRNYQKWANPHTPLVRKKNQKFAYPPPLPPSVADIICEQPLRQRILKQLPSLMFNSKPSN